MTIKRKLFWSNVLMVIVPIVLSAILSGIVIAALATSSGEAYYSTSDSSTFENVKYEIDYFASGSEDTSFDNALEYWMNMIERADGNGVSLGVYKDGALIAQTDNYAESDLFQLAQEYPDISNFSADEQSLYRIELEGQTVYLQNLNLFEGEYIQVEGDDNGGLIGLAVILVVIGVFIVTGRVITHLVFKSIAEPLDILVAGVHQIRDGNLGYRIQYARKDEFKQVCDDFNEMAAQTQQLVQARQKDEESRRELIAGMTHDLRTPLTSIQAYTEGLIEGVAATPALKDEYLDTILHKSKDLERIIEQLFMFSKLDTNNFPFRFEVLDIGQELENYVAYVRDDYERRGLLVKLGEVEKGMKVRVDQLQLRNVFTNVLENSLKYGHAAEPRVELSCERHDERVYVILTDNGPGVAEQKLIKLFDAFYRTDKARRNPGGGSGLGLAIAGKVTQQMGGRIGAKNLPPMGLSICLDLPLVKDEQ